MAIRLITGGLGSGKTYLAVHHIVETYYEADKANGGYRKKEKFKDVALISNIDELALPGVLDLDQVLKKSGMPINKFFTVDYQKKVSEKYKQVVYLIDECQRYFGRKFYDQDVFFYFEYSRHLGHDIWLISQDRYRLSKEIASLAEFEIRAVKRSLSIGGELKYNKLMDGEIVGRKGLMPKKDIYGLYKSMMAEEVEKKNNPIIKYIAVPIVLLFVTGSLFYWVFWGRISEAKQKIDDQKEAGQVEAKRAIGSITRRGSVDGEYAWKAASVVVVGKRAFYYDREVGRLVLIDDSNKDRLRIEGGVVMVWEKVGQYQGKGGKKK